MNLRAAGLAIAVGAAVFLQASQVQAQQAPTREQVIGTWKLLKSVREEAATGKVVDNIGAHPKGVLVITPEGRFIIIETAEGRKAASAPEEFAQLQKTELAYSGLVEFSTDPQNPASLKMVNHVDIAWNEEWAGTDQVRFLSLDGDKLTIRTAAIKNPLTGVLATATLVFVRSK
jgi:hypothetical protein